MLRHVIIAFATLSIFSLPAFAAEEYWVVKNESTKKCEVVEKKPDGKTHMEVGKAAHKTKEAAEKAMKAAAECK